MGGSLSCTGLLPSRLALHRMPSGKETYTTDLPSFEKSKYRAEMPLRKGSNLPDFESNRTSSPRKVKPSAKIFFPSLLGSGSPQLIGPEVNWTGSAGC